MTSNVQRKTWPFRVSQVPQEKAVPMDVKAGAGDSAQTVTVTVAVERVRSQNSIRTGLVADGQPAAASGRTS